MKIATFNVNSVRSRMNAVLTWLAQHQPDALCLQETKVQDHEFPLQPFIDAGYHVSFRGQKSYNGVAVLSREKPSIVRYGLEDCEPLDESRLIHVRIGDVSIVNTYIPQGRDIEHEMFGYKLKWFKRLRSYFDKNFNKNDAVVWVGDCNVAAEPIDVHNPEAQTKHVCYHQDARDAFSQCRAWGFVDVFRKFHPEPGHYTFYDYRVPDSVKNKRGWRIDYILASPGFAEKATDAHIDLEPRLQPKASDHTVMSATFG